MQVLQIETSSYLLIYDLLFTKFAYDTKYIRGKVCNYYGIFFNIELRNKTSNSTHKKAASANQRYSS